MPDNVLKATISVTAPGVKETFAQVANSTKAAESNLNQLGTTVNKTEAVIRQMPPVVNEVSLSLKDQRSILASLEQQYARLSTAQAKSRIGRELAADIKIANAEIKRLEVGTVSSFGAIGKSATKGFSAIRQLAFILPGIGIAGIFNLAFTAIEQLISGFDSLSKKTKLYKEISDQLAKGVAEDLTKLTSLVGLVQNVNTSNDDRVKGLKALNEQYAQYLPNLDKEGITLQNISAAYDAIVQSLLRQAVVKGLQKEIQAEVEKTAAQIIRYREAEERRRIASEAANKATGDTTTAIQDAGQKLQQYNQIVRDGTQALAGRTAELKRNATNFGATSIDRLTAELKKQLEPLLNLTTNFEDLDIKLKGEKQVGSEVDKIIAHGKRLAAEFGKLNEIHLEVLPIFSELDTKAEQLKKAQQIIKDVNQFFNDFSSKQRALKLVIPVAPVPFLIPPDQALVALTQKEITEILKSVADFKPEVETKFDITIEIAVKLDKFKEQLKKDLASAFNIKITPPDLSPVEKQLLDIQNQAIFAADTISGVLTPAFQGLFDAILEGEDPLKSFFEGLGQAVQQLISKLVAAAVEALVLAAIFGSIGGASGFGAIFAKLLGFEKGGRPPVGKDVLVGEKRTEIFVPDVGQPVLLGVGGPHLFRADRPGKIIPKVGKEVSSVLGSISKTTGTEKVVIRDSNKVKEVSQSISRIVTTVLDKVAQFQSTTLDKVASFHSSVSSSFEKVIGWTRDVTKDRSRESVNNTGKEITYVDRTNGLKEIYKLFSSDVTAKSVHLTTASTSKELYSVAALKEISSTLAKVFEYSTASTSSLSSKVSRETSVSAKNAHTEDKTTEKNFTSVFASLVEKGYSNVTSKLESFKSDSTKKESGYEKTISSGFEKLNKVSTSDKAVNTFQSLVTSATGSIKELKELFASYTNASLTQKDSSQLKDSSSTKIFESVRQFTSEIINTFSSVLERIIDRLKPQPIPAISNNITKIISAASTLNNLTFRAKGGPVSRNAPTIVGENGAEFFMPSVSGTIIPHNKIASFTKSMKEVSAFNKLYHTDKEINIFKSSKAFKELSALKVFKSMDLTKMSHKQLKTIFGSTFDGGRAGGGFIRGGNLVLVGERGREVFVPSIGQNITTNNNSVGSISGAFSGGGSHKVVFEIAGQTLVGVLTLGQQQLRRLS